MISVRPSLQLSFFHLWTWPWVLSPRERRGSLHNKKNSCYRNLQWPMVRIWKRAYQGEQPNVSQGGFSCWQIQAYSHQGNQTSKLRGKQNIHQLWVLSIHKISIHRRMYPCTHRHWGPYALVQSHVYKFWKHTTRPLGNASRWSHAHQMWQNSPVEERGCFRAALPSVWSQCNQPSGSLQSAAMEGDVSPAKWPLSGQVCAQQTIFCHQTLALKYSWFPTWIPKYAFSKAS